MELFERGGGAVARLYWRKPSDISAGLPRNVAPQQYLFSQVTPTVLAVVQTCTDLKTLSVSFSRTMQGGKGKDSAERSEEHTSELQSLMRIAYAVFRLKNKKEHYH